jgi:hypothetical protein
MSSPTSTPRQNVTLAGEPGDEPLSVTATVEHVTRRQENGIYGRMVGLDALLHLLYPGDKRPHSYCLSRLVDEPCWVQDAHFGPTGFPHFSNGFGARYLKLRGIHPALEALLDEVTRAHGLAVEIGPGIPLILTATSPATSDQRHA